MKTTKKMIRTTVQAAIPPLLAMFLAAMPTPSGAQNSTLYNWHLVNDTRTDIVKVSQGLTLRITNDWLRSCVARGN
jgi:hypothetical protein